MYNIHNAHYTRPEDWKQVWAKACICRCKQGVGVRSEDNCDANPASCKRNVEVCVDPSPNQHLVQYQTSEGEGSYLASSFGIQAFGVQFWSFGG